MNDFSPPVFATATDKNTARQRWHDRFHNRAPAARTPGKIEVKAAADGVTEILIYDEIGYWGVTAKEFVAELSRITTAAITVGINSPGGDVFDGLAIYNALKGHAARVTCRIDGWAASAASVIALGGDEVVMADNALMMCHRAWTMALGNRDDMTETVAILDKIDGQLAAIYAAKSGKTAAECVAMMAGEGKNDGTWFTAQEAKDFGLIDEVTQVDPEETKPTGAPPEDSLRQRVSAMKRRLAICERDD